MKLRISNEVILSAPRGCCCCCCEGRLLGPACCGDPEFDAESRSLQRTVWKKFTSGRSDEVVLAVLVGADAALATVPEL